MTTIDEHPTCNAAAQSQDYPETEERLYRSPLHHSWRTTYALAAWLLLAPLAAAAIIGIGSIAATHDLTPTPTTQTLPPPPANSGVCPHTHHLENCW